VINETLLLAQNDVFWDMTPHNKVEIFGTQQQQQKRKTNLCSHDRLGWDVFRRGILSCLQAGCLGV
jgi:hypothetical protein